MALNHTQDIFQHNSETSRNVQTVETPKISPPQQSEDQAHPDRRLEILLSSLSFPGNVEAHVRCEALTCTEPVLVLTAEAAAEPLAPSRNPRWEDASAGPMRLESDRIRACAAQQPYQVIPKTGISVMKVEDPSQMKGGRFETGLLNYSGIELVFTLISSGSLF